MIPVRPVGSGSARILLVGDVPSHNDARVGKPFSDYVGKELASLMHEADFTYADCRVVTCTQTPDRIENIFGKSVKNPAAIVEGEKISKSVLLGMEQLKEEIRKYNPLLIIALGNLPLWLLTGETSVVNWRGSVMRTKPVWGEDNDIPLIPTIHPLTMTKVWDWRPLMQVDFKRAKLLYDGKLCKPEERFIVAPDFATAKSHLLSILDVLEVSQEPMRLAVDIETRNRIIDCIGIAWSAEDAICIPFDSLDLEGPWYELNEELELILLLRRILRHPNARVVGQNYQYDSEYMAFNWGFLSIPSFDTMVAQGVAFPGMPKALHILSSLYLEYHEYWKEENKNVQEDRQRWVYNCKDCVRTWALQDPLEQTLRRYDLWDQFQDRMRNFKPLMLTILRGVRVDRSVRSAQIHEIQEQQALMQDWFRRAAGDVWSDIQLVKSKTASEWFDSPIQLAKILYDVLKVQKVRGSRSTKDDVLTEVAKKNILIRPLAERILEYRSLGVVLSNHLMARLSPDGRIRTSYGLVGTETMRYNSKKNCFGDGANLQNATKGGRQRFVTIPNLRKWLVPDPGYVIFDVDLDRADLQVVVWEADEPDLKRRLRQGVDLHITNGLELENKPCPPDDELVPSHPNYPEHAARYKKERVANKAFIHGTNYGGSARTMAINTGITVHQSEQRQHRWFSIYPGFKKWHERVEDNLLRTRTIHNAFGYRCYFAGRIEQVLPQALAWIPQSTVALVINKGFVNLDENMPDLQVLLQVHDSLVYQIPEGQMYSHLKEAELNLLVPIPYEDTLTIPVGFAASRYSWGDVKAVEVPH